MNLFFFKVWCLHQIVLAGLGDHVARRISTDNMNTEDKQRLKSAYQVGIIFYLQTILTTELLGFSPHSEYPLWGSCFSPFIIRPTICQIRICCVSRISRNFKIIYEGGDSYWGIMATHHLARELYLFCSTGTLPSLVWRCHGNNQMSHNLQLW